jgi:D-3-phosphoglycerate dehydrogenase
VVDALRQTDFRHALNMPFQAGIDFRAIRPYITLAEKMGSLQAGLAEGPIETVQIEVNGEAVAGIVRAIAAGLLVGLLADTHPEPLNVISAPVIAAHKGIKIAQTTGQSPMPENYPNVVSCRVSGADWEHLTAGTLFSNGDPGIIQLDDYKLDVRPMGSILLLKNKDVPGVMGQIGTILGAYDVNIGEWRMGRDMPGGIALSFINLDSVPPPSALNTLEKITAVTNVKLVNL